MQKVINCFLFVFIIHLLSCETPIEPVRQTEKTPYMTLSVGDIHQYKDSAGSVYFKWEILDTTKRSDNLKVFRIEELLLVSDVLFRAENYYYLSKEYFITTQLDTVDSLSNCQNPFAENKLAKIYPNNLDNFLINNCTQEGAKILMAITIIDSLKTSAKTFSNVAKYTEFDNDSTTNNNVFYAKNYGHIGTIYSNKYGNSKILLNYYKSGTLEFGKYIPFIQHRIPMQKKQLMTLIF